MDVSGGMFAFDSKMGSRAALSSAPVRCGTIDATMTPWGRSRRRFAARLAHLAFAGAIAGRALPLAAAQWIRPGRARVLRVAALAEQALKLQAQIGQGILVGRARRSLAAALRAMDAAVRALGTPPAPSELHERTAILALLVAQYRARASRPPAREAAAAMGERAEEIEWEAERIAALLGADDGSPPALAARAIDGAFRAERIARLLLWRRWGIEPPDAQAALAAAKDALRSDLEALRTGAGATARTRSELQVAENQAAFLFAAGWRLDAAERSKDLEFAVKASDNARESFERLAVLYERMG
jgi:hypothetical protein